MALKSDRNNYITRPTKSGKKKRQRLKVQAKRLAALGVSEEKLKHLTAERIRELLQRPCLITSGKIKV